MRLRATAVLAILFETITAHFGLLIVLSGFTTTRNKSDINDFPRVTFGNWFDWILCERGSITLNKRTRPRIKRLRFCGAPCGPGPRAHNRFMRGRSRLFLIVTQIRLVRPKLANASKGGWRMCEYDPDYAASRARPLRRRRRMRFFPFGVDWRTKNPIFFARFRFCALKPFTAIVRLTYHRIYF